MSFSKRIIAAGVHNPVFANLAAVGILIGGFVGARSLHRETFPETAVDWLEITVAYPGANPLDVEKGVSIKIEEAIKGIVGFGEISSLSTDQWGKIVAEFDSSVLPATEVLRQIQDRVGSITTFPKEAERPVIQEFIYRDSVISVGVSGDVPERTIKSIAEQIQRDLMSNREISQVSLSGVRDFELSIKLTEVALKRYDLTLADVIKAVIQSSLDLPAGTVRTLREEINVRTIGQRYTVNDFEELVVVANRNGTSLRLGQIAEITDSFEQTPIFGRVNGKPGVMINVSKTAREDTIRIANIVRAYVDEVGKRLPEGIKLNIWADTSRDVDARLKMLIKNGLLGMVLVLLCLIGFLDFRSALGAALGIPVAFAGALAVMAFNGWSLNMISLLGLLMATGIIVDDAIVVAESVRACVREGLPLAQASVEGAHRVALPVIMSSVTTIIAFIPLMHVEGVMAKFIYVFPVVVIAAIIASSFEAFLILPAHLFEWGASGKSSATEAGGWRDRWRRRMDQSIDDFLDRRYARWLRSACRARFVVLGLTFSAVLICLGLVLGGRAPFVLFPKIDGNTLRARVRFPEGMPIKACQNAVAQMERAALSLNSLESLATKTDGELVQQIYSVSGEWPDFVPSPGSSLCETSLELMPSELREVDSAAIIEQWRKSIGVIPDAQLIAITRQQVGPSQKPIEIRVLGDELAEIRAAADEVSSHLASYQGVFDIDDDLLPGKRELRVTLKPEAHNLGITVADLATQLRQALFGAEAVRLQRGTDEIKVIVSFGDEERTSLSAIENMRIRGRWGGAVPFAEVADTELVRGYSSIGRQDGHRRVRVQADVDERFANAEQVVSAMVSTVLPELDAKYPGVTFLVDGERERINESMASLTSAFGIAMVVVFAILGAVLRSYVQPIVIMAAIPLGMVGSIFGHFLLGYELTLMSVFGMVALAGIVVNDSLVLVDQINKSIQGGMGVMEAVIYSGRSRFRAVILTTITTVAGLLPLLLERSSQAQSLIPMAISVAFGLILATGLTLFVVPAMYLVVNDAKRCVRWMRRGGAFPAPEAVERAVTARSA